MRSRAAVVVAALTTLAATACAPDSGRGLDDVSALGPGADAVAADAIKPGQCFVGARLRDNPSALAAALARPGVGAYDAIGDDPAWTDPVSCARPHQIEVYGVAGLPPQLENAVRSYADLVNPDSKVYRAVDDEVRRGCAAAFPPSASAARSAPLSVDVMPFWPAGAGVETTWAPAPPAVWDAGDHAIACLFEQRRPATTVLADVASASFPSAARSCLRGASFVPCRQRHDEERFAVVGLDRAVAEGQLAGVRAVDDSGRVDLGADAWAALDGVCQRYLDAVAPWHDRALHGVANTYPELYPDADGRYSVLCTAQSPFGSSPADVVVTTGSLFERR
jgi:hypothetical protein